MTITAKLIEDFRQINRKEAVNFRKHQPTCLLVEDDESDIALNERALRRFPIDLKIARTGDEALRLLDASKDPKHPDFDIVFLDLVLRGSAAQGIQVLEHIRTFFPSVHVILVSGHIDEGIFEYVRKHRGNGASYLGIVTKPLKEVEVGNIIKKHRMNKNDFEV